MEIITGYVGKPHVTAEQDRDINIGIFGAESYVLQTGRQLKAEVSSNNEIKIRDGVLMHQGCAASIKKNTYDSLTIINGSQGMQRIDLIVARYEKNQDDGTESFVLKVNQGTPAETNPKVPSYTEGDIQTGDYISEVPLYQVIISGLNITDVKSLLPIVKSASALQSELAKVKVSTIQYPITLTYSEHISEYLGWVQIPAADLAKYGRIVGTSFHASSAVPGNTSWYYSGNVAYVYASSVDATGRLYVTFLMEAKGEWK